MEPLDEGQQRELQYQLAHNGWLSRSRPKRVAIAVGIAIAFGASLGGLVYLADGPWRLWSAASGAGFLIVLSPVVLRPASATRWWVRVMHPSAEAMRRGDHNKNWPG